MAKTKEEISGFIEHSLASLIAIEDHNNRLNIAIKGNAPDTIFLLAKLVEDVSNGMNVTPKELFDIILPGLEAISELDDCDEEGTK